VFTVFDRNIYKKDSQTGVLRFTWIIKSRPIFYCSLFVLALITKYGISGENIFYGGYGISQFQMSTAMEYYCIFLLVSIFSAKGKYDRILILLFVIVYSIRVFLYGGRVPVIQVWLLIYLAMFLNRFSNKILICFLLFSTIILEVFSSIRANPLLVLSALNADRFNLNNSVILSNQGDVFYSSTVFINMRHLNVVPVLTRLKSLFGFILSFFLRTDSLWEEANLSGFLASLSSFGGGGLFPAYFYFWFGVPGVIIAAYIVHRIVKGWYNINPKTLKGVYLSLAFATFPRWFAYSPISLYKLSTWGVIVYFIIRLLHKYMSKSLNHFNS